MDPKPIEIDFDTINESFSDLRDHKKAQEVTARLMDPNPIERDHKKAQEVTARQMGKSFWDSVEDIDDILKLEKEKRERKKSKTQVRLDKKSKQKKSNRRANKQARLNRRKNR